MTNLDSVFKIRDITLPTKIHILKASGFPLVMYGCESWTIEKVKVKVTDFCLTLGNCIVHGILQARIPEWVAFPFSSGSSQPRNQTGVSCIAGRFFTN